MLETVLAVIAGALMVSSILDIVNYFIEKFGSIDTMPEEIQAEMSETDKQMIDETQNIILECFGDDIVSYLTKLNDLEKILAVDKFAKILADDYGLDIKINVFRDEQMNVFGFYSHSKKEVNINLELIMHDTNKDYAIIVHRLMDTIIHEMRHAVQYQAIEQPGFWNIDDQRRNTWGYNFQNYINYDVDFHRYWTQPVENDAQTFASLCMEGVIEHENNI